MSQICTKTQRKTAGIFEWTSPCGPLVLAGLGCELLMADWAAGWHHQTIVRRLERMLPLVWERGSLPVIQRTVRELEEYFAGARRTFDIPLRFLGTPFQIDVWHALGCIPYGSLVRYGDIAREIGRPRSSRAVGAAVGQNPFSILVPCHRVIGRDGTLTGYGGGYAAKRRLLALELGVPEGEFPYETGAAAHAPTRTDDTLAC